MMTDRELMQQALSALVTAELDGNCEYGVTDSLRARLEQPEPEPVAWMRKDKGHIGFHKVAPSGYVPLYTAPPKKEWLSLTDDELHALHYELKVQMQGAIGTIGMYRILEKALKEKNNV